MTRSDGFRAASKDLGFWDAPSLGRTLSTFRLTLVTVVAGARLTLVRGIAAVY
jgi:hypothetical protein